MPQCPERRFSGCGRSSATTRSTITVTPEGTTLLATLAAAQSAQVHVRSHFLFNSGDGTPALKWGSTGVYSETPAANPFTTGR